MNSTITNKNAPGILSISNPDSPPQLNKVKKRCLMLSPTVNAGLERECKMSDFEKDPRAIGKGGFGQVWKVIHKKTNKVYCIKVIQKSGIIEQKLVNQMNREIEIMYLLNHPHCLRLKNHFEDDDNFYLVMPLATKGQLYKLLKRAHKFDERTTAQILRETISALQYLHSFKPPIIHRDIKPENLLLNESGRILLADFGWSNFKNDGDIRKTFCGTPEYIAPEMLRKEGHDHRIDIWSIGVLMFELLSGYSPFCAKTNQDLYANIRKLKINWPPDMPPLAKNLISKILKLNPKDRLSLEDILNHQWFQQTKMLKPLLQNTLNTEKDLLIYHMVSEVSDKVTETINHLLNLSGENAANKETAKKIHGETPDNEGKKHNIIKQIQSQQTGNSNVNNINVTKEQTDTLKIENLSLKQNNINLKTKIQSYENEIKTLKAENYKLKEVDTTNLQEQVKKLNSEIEKYQIKDKDRLQILTELEEKNTLNRELNSKLQMSENEKIQKDKEINNLKEQLKISKKEIEAKQISIDELKKNNDLLIQEKEQLFCDYQKKIEMLQLKMLDSTSAESSSDGITRAIEIINENVDEFKNIFKKKFDSFVENFNQFKKEYLDRNDELINLLNDKTKNISNEVQKYSKSAQSDIETIFNNVNKAGNSIHEQTIEFYKKQVSKLSECQKSDISNKTQIEILTNEINNMKNQLKVSQELNVDKDKLIFLKDEQLNKKLDYISKIEAILSDMKNFMYSNMNDETLELFNKNFNTPV